jgi:hypothetical protein
MAKRNLSTAAAQLALAVYRKYQILLSEADALALVRDERRLQRWAEAECNGDIQREESTGQPMRHYGRAINPYLLTVKTADIEKSALARIAKVCTANGLHFYHQGDCRGCMLYVHNAPLPDNNYTIGVACC